MPTEDRFIELMREVSTDSLELQVRMWHEWRRGVGRLYGLGSGLLRPGNGGTSALEDFASEAMRLSLEFQDKYLKLCSTHFDRVSESLGGRSRRTKPSRLDLCAKVTGPRAATTQVIIENPLGSREEVLFGSAAFHDDTGRGFRARIDAERLESASLGPGDGVTLNAYQSGLFELTITADADFPAGARCQGSARVFIGTEFLGDLTIEVQSAPVAIAVVAAGAAAPAAVAKKVRKGAKKK